MSDLEDGATATRASRDREICRTLLPRVSRTFALTIRVLPEPLRLSVTVAYLLCRIADVLEDATFLNPEPRARTLDAFGTALRGRLELTALSRALEPADSLRLEDPDSIALLRQRDAVVRTFLDLPLHSRDIVARWVADMAEGMAEFVRREDFAGSDSKSESEVGSGSISSARSLSLHETIPHVLQTAEELRTYAYYVAGTVGRLLTELFAAHLGASSRDLEARLTPLAVPFGLGLQFTNILQDLAEDRLRGWSYVPEELAQRHGTSTARLLQPDERQAARRVVGELVHEAARYLDQAVEFTLLLPRRAPRIRLFCVWPVFFAIRTLTKVWAEDALFDASRKVRIGRGDVRRVVGMTAAACLSNDGLRRLYERERARLHRRMHTHPI